MLKKNITYTDPFTEKEVTETHYFHISKADVMEMNLEEHKATYVKDGVELTGLQAYLQRMIDSEDAKTALENFKSILRRGYGQKVGDKFVKNAAVWAEFDGSPAYDQLLWELYTDVEVMAEFINGMVPKDLQQEAERLAAKAERTSDAPGTKPPVTQIVDEKKPDPAEVEAQAPVETSPAETDRSREIATATSENPVKLTLEESAAMDHTTLQAGIADGRYKLS